MQPHEIARAYNKIADQWLSEDFNLSYGISQHQRAIQFVKEKSLALDVGCGATGRFIELLLKHGFTPEGLDLSVEMLKHARNKHPNINFYQANICEWELEKSYDLISAWDSIWHIPLNEQANVICKLIKALNKDGVLIFSCGGVDVAGEHTNNTMGVEMYYSSLSILGYHDLLQEHDVVIRHCEYDKYPEKHLYFIVQKL